MKDVLTGKSAKRQKQKKDARMQLIYLFGYYYGHSKYGKYYGYGKKYGYGYGYGDKDVNK